MAMRHCTKCPAPLHRRPTLRAPNRRAAKVVPAGWTESCERPVMFAPPPVRGQEKEGKSDHHRAPQWEIEHGVPCRTRHEPMHEARRTVQEPKPHFLVPGATHTVENEPPTCPCVVSKPSAGRTAPHRTGVGRGPIAYIELDYALCRLNRNPCVQAARFPLTIVYKAEGVESSVTAYPQCC